MSWLYGIPIREILELDALRGLRIVAGHNGLSRLVLNVNIMEVPDISSWIGEGQLLLTTGYPIKDNADAQAELIPMLAEKKLAGLVIKTKRYIPEIPQSMISAANRYDFPLIEMPSELSHPIMLEIIYQELSSRQTGAMQISALAHQSMVDLLVEGGGAPELSRLMYSLYNHELYITDRHRKILGAGTQPVSDENEAFVVDFLKKNGSGSSRTQFVQCARNGEEVSAVIVPIMLSNHWQGSILSFVREGPAPRMYVIDLERAATIIALIISHKNELREVEQRFQNELLYDILFGKISSREVLKQRSAALGWQIREPLQLLLIHFYSVGEQAVLSIEMNRGAHRAIDRALSGRHRYIGNVGEDFVVLLQMESGLGLKRINKQTRQAAEQILEVLRERIPLPCRISVGSFRQDIMELNLCFSEARSAMDVGSSFQNRESIYFFEDQGIHRMLYHLEKTEISRLVREYYLPLNEYDQIHSTHLAETVKAYFELNGNVSKVSKRLFTHYNTILYRIDTIFKLIGVNMKNAQDSMLLYIAVLLGEGKLPDKVEQGDNAATLVEVLQ